MSLEDNIRKVVPYIPGEQPRNKVLKLNTNECPYPPSPKVLKAMHSFDWKGLRLYPDPVMSDLIDSIASYYGVKPTEVFAGTGSDDVLSMCFLTFFAGDKPVLFPDITYSFYDVWAEVYRIPYITKELDKDFRIRAEDYMGENGGIVIANPNAPTGISSGRDLLEEIIKNNRDSVVVVDEAYIDFGGESVLPLIEDYDNLIVVRTMSKSRALAGMRIGYCFGCEKLIKYLNDVKYSVNSYTLNSPSIAAGKAAVEDEEYFREIVGKTVATRQKTAEELKELGWDVLPSDTNFLFASPPAGYDAGTIFEELKNRGIYVRHFNKKRITDHLRISMGTDEQMSIFISTIKELTGK
ncbi:MAG: histidinol-phosphate transaminase [Lachnospiraceae bacterium]|nr:histidinol-phosphate transaminase [Lachnospiraceae bacterium]